MPTKTFTINLGRLNGALRRLQPVFTPEQFKLLFDTPLSAPVQRAAEKISVKSTVIKKSLTGDLDRYVELSAGYKQKKVRRNVFVKADDAESIRGFREKCSDVDVYISSYQYVSDRPPVKGLTRFCPKSGDFVIELESETGDRHENVAGALEAARHCATVIEQVLKIPRNAACYYYNGGKSFYITIPQRVLGLPDCVELNIIYERVARHIRDNMVTEYQAAVDMNLYNHDRPLRIPGTVHPKHGLYNTRLKVEEFFELPSEKNHPARPVSPRTGILRTSVR